MTLQGAFKCDYEFRLPLEHVKYAMLDGSEGSGGWDKHRLLRLDARNMVL